MGGTLANKLGVEYKAKDSDINYVMHKIIHGVIGGISGLISGGTEEAFASAIGATIGEIVGEKFEGSHQGGIYDPEHPSYDAKEREAMVRKGTLFSELSAAVFAGLLGQDPNAAARAANTAVTENSFSLGSYEDLSLHNRTEKEVEELEAALAQETNPEKREQLEGKLSWRRDMLQTRDDQQAEYARIGERYLGPVCDWGLSEIENETYRRIAGSWNTTLDGVHSWTSNMREFHSPLVLDGLNIGSTLSGIDFAADLFKLPTTKGGAALFAIPMATTAFSVLKTAGRGTINSLRNVPIFDIRHSAPSTLMQLETGLTRELYCGELARLTGPMTTASGRRYLSGVASHDRSLPGILSRPNWIRGSEGNAAKIPAEVAEKLAGREFKNFDHFREALWLEVSKNPTLIQGFSKRDKWMMNEGLTPAAQVNQRLGLRAKYELDHMQELQHGGNVYDMNNIIIRTPLNHVKGKQ